jgi:hypothetical protein
MAANGEKLSHKNLDKDTIGGLNKDSTNKDTARKLIGESQESKETLGRKSFEQNLDELA